MRRIATLAIFFGFLTPLLASAPAHAQASRTWVSGVGDDANPCSRTAPCKTFAGAISKTATNGEINCLDPGGFGAVTITKSITIDCHEIFGSVLVSGTNGINIAAAGGNVTLRNLNLDGLAGGGIRGISISAANSVVLEDLNIFGFAQQAIADVRTTGGNLTVSNTTARNNLGAGIGTASTGGTLKVEVNNFRSFANAFGLGIGTNANIVVKRSTFSNSSSNGIDNQGSTIAVDDSSISGNVIGVNNGSGTVRLSNNDIANNTTGIASGAGGSVITYGNNRNSSATPTTGTITPAGVATSDLGQQ
jgi:hypothetical protein